MIGRATWPRAAVVVAAAAVLTGLGACSSYGSTYFYNDTGAELLVHRDEGRSPVRIAPGAHRGVPNNELSHAPTVVTVRGCRRTSEITGPTHEYYGGSGGDVQLQVEADGRLLLMPVDASAIMTQEALAPFQRYGFSARPNTNGCLA